MPRRPSQPYLRVVVYGVLVVVGGVGMTSNMMLTRETKRIQQEVALSTAISHQALLVEQMARQAWHLSGADAPDARRAARAALQRSVTDLSGSRQSAAQLTAQLARSGNAADIKPTLSAQLHAYQTVALQLTRTADGPAAERASGARWMDQQASGGLAAALQETQRAVERSSDARSRRLATFTWYRPVIVLSLLLFLTLLVFRPLEKRIERVQDELVQERDFALQVMTTVGQGLSVTDTQGRFEYVNPAYARLLNDTPDNLLGRTPFDVTFEEDHDRLRSVRTQRQEGGTSTYETRLKRADGRAVPVLITGSPRLSGTQWAGTIAAITDLSAHKETEQAIRILAALSHSLELERTPDGVTERALQVLSEAIDLAWLVLYVRDGSTFCPTLTSGAVPPEIWTQLSRGVPQGEGRIWDTLNGQAVYMDESARPDYAALGVGSVALIPLLRSTGDVTQVLCAFRGSRAQGWTAREQVLLDTAARSISAALERAELHQEAQNNAAYAETLLAVSALAESAVGPLDIALQTLQLLAPTLELSQGSVLLLRGEGVEAVTAWDRTPFLEQLRQQLSPADQELLLAGVHRAARGGARYVPHYAQEPDAIAALVEAGLRSVAWIPVATLRGTQYLFVITRFGGLRGWPPRDQALIGAATRTVRVAFERQESLRQLEQVALTDPLTGLGNRRAMDRALHAWTTEADHPFAVLMMDLDGLKEVNDALGHDWGDRLLREFGQELRARVRSDDLVFRPSGDEFVVLLPEVQPAQTPEILAWVQDAAARVRRHPELRACGASAGLAFSHESQSPSVLLNLADERMYHDKRDRKPKRT